MTSKTAQEKAEELYKKMENSSAKKCAIHAVEEVIDALDKSLIDADIEWYRHVKNEIEKLGQKCMCCGRTQEEIRLGFCWDCANAESVIEDGTDMRDDPPPKIEGFSTSMSKLQFILKRYIKINND